MNVCFGSPCDVVKLMSKLNVRSITIIRMSFGVKCGPENSQPFWMSVVLSGAVDRAVEELPDDQPRARGRARGRKQIGQPIPHMGGDM